MELLGIKYSTQHEDDDVRGRIMRWCRFAFDTPLSVHDHYHPPRIISSCIWIPCPFRAQINCHITPLFRGCTWNTPTSRSHQSLIDICCPTWEWIYLPNNCDNAIAIYWNKRNLNGFFFKCSFMEWRTRAYLKGANGKHVEGRTKDEFKCRGN